MEKKELTKRELMEVLYSLLPVINDEEKVELTRVLLKITNRAILDGSLELTE